MIAYTTQFIDVADGCKVCYRESGPVDAPVLLAAHGFPSSSFQYRHLLTGLGHEFRVIAPDLPGFGFTVVPDKYEYTFDNLSKTLEAFVDALKLKKMAVYIFDYGAPTVLRMALRRPELIAAIISQSGNAFEEGLGEFWDPIKSIWDKPTEEKKAALAKKLFSLETTKLQYEHGESKKAVELLPPECAWLDWSLMSREGNHDIQLALFYDYRTNVDMYPAFQSFLKDKQIPLLACWGKSDFIFVPAGAEAFKRILPKAKVVFIDGGHFALESHEKEIVDLVGEFLGEHIGGGSKH